MKSLTRPRLGLETLRRLNWLAEHILSVFFNLEAVETALLTSRTIEYPFVIQALESLPRGNVLDVGCADVNNFLAPSLASLGWQVYGVDLRGFKLVHPGFHLVREDIRETSFPDAFFDCAYAVSTVEHIGLAGRYGITVDDPGGDIKAVREIRRILRPGGSFFLTVPYGRGGKVIKPTERVYDRARLERLLADWTVRNRLWYHQDNGGRWGQVSEEAAGRASVALALVESIRPGQ